MHGPHGAKQLQLSNDRWGRLSIHYGNPWGWGWEPIGGGVSDHGSGEKIIIHIDFEAQQARLPQDLASAVEVYFLGVPRAKETSLDLPSPTFFSVRSFKHLLRRPPKTAPPNSAARPPRRFDRPNGHGTTARLWCGNYVLQEVGYDETASKVSGDRGKPVKTGAHAALGLGETPEG